MVASVISCKAFTIALHAPPDMCVCCTKHRGDLHLGENQSGPSKAAGSGQQQQPAAVSSSQQQQPTAAPVSSKQAAGSGIQDQHAFTITLEFILKTLMTHNRLQVTPLSSETGVDMMRSGLTCKIITYLQSRQLYRCISVWDRIEPRQPRLTQKL